MSNDRWSNASPNRRAVLRLSAGTALAGGILGIRQLTVCYFGRKCKRRPRDRYPHSCCLVITTRP